MHKENKPPQNIQSSKQAVPKEVNTERGTAVFSNTENTSKRALGRTPKSLEELLDKARVRAQMKRSITRELKKRKKVITNANIYTSPYSYIYAEYLKGTRHEKHMRSIENRLTDLGIAGKIHRLSQFKNLKEIIDEDVRRGVSTIVVVGDDTIVKSALEAVVGTGVVLGIIPIPTMSNKIAEFFGIAEGVHSCDILSQRIIDKIDVGDINGKIFFSRVFIHSQRAPIVCDKEYEFFSHGSEVTIFNLNLEIEDKSIPKINPKDAKFEIFIKPKTPLGNRFGIGKKKEIKNSLFFAKKVSMRSSLVFSVYVDGKKIFYKNAVINIIPKGLKIIVGKNRKI